MRSWPLLPLPLPSWPVPCPGPGRGPGASGPSPFLQPQQQAIDLIRDGRDVMVATPTASGKSLIYTIPVLERLLVDPAARALYLFPLKALARISCGGSTSSAATSQTWGSGWP